MCKRESARLTRGSARLAEARVRLTPLHEQPTEQEHHADGGERDERGGGDGRHGRWRLGGGADAVTGAATKLGAVLRG